MESDVTFVEGEMNEEAALESYGRAQLEREDWRQSLNYLEKFNIREWERLSPRSRGNGELASLAIRSSFNV